MINKSADTQYIDVIYFGCSMRNGLDDYNISNKQIRLKAGD